MGAGHLRRSSARGGRRCRCLRRECGTSRTSWEVRFGSSWNLETQQRESAWVSLVLNIHPKLDWERVRRNEYG